MDLHVRGEPQDGVVRRSHEGRVMATAISPKTGEVELLVSGESDGVGATRLRRVPMVSVLQHRCGDSRDNNNAEVN
jgi:hypothetical protein